MLKTITLVAVANLVAVTLGLNVAQASNYNQRHTYRFERCHYKHYGYNDRYDFRHYGSDCYIWRHKHHFPKWY